MREGLVNRNSFAAAIVLSAAAAFGSLAPPSLQAQPSGAPAFAAERLSGDLTPVHDPAIIKAGDTYYLFSTTRPNDAGQIAIRTSKDLMAWSRAGAVFTAIPEWARHEIANAAGMWAPDISFAKGEYRLYYAVSTFGSNHSVIGLATSPTLDPTSPAYHWTDHGMVLRSSTSSDYNAIDPAAFTDREGGQWLAFGSFWTGIKMVRLDPATGKPSTTDATVYPVARRPNPDAIEAPFLIEHDGSYYLFASHDYCCRGADSTYYTVVGRSRQVTGPYLDYDGKPMMQGYGQIVLHAKLDPSGRWRGPGHSAVLNDGGRMFIVYHAYDARNKGVPTLRVAPLGWTADGWPVARY